MSYPKEYVRIFLEKQGQLFDEPVAETLEEAADFLEECMAEVVDSDRAVQKYFEENGTDTSGMSREELLGQSEVFALPGGKYLIVEG